MKLGNSTCWKNLKQWMIYVVESFLHFSTVGYLPSFVNAMRKCMCICMCMCNVYVYVYVYAYVHVPAFLVLWATCHHWSML